jgi:hypothetical protein
MNFVYIKPQIDSSIFPIKCFNNFTEIVYTELTPTIYWLFRFSATTIRNKTYFTYTINGLLYASHKPLQSVDRNPIWQNFTNTVPLFPFINKRNRGRRARRAALRPASLFPSSQKVGWRGDSSHSRSGGGNFEPRPLHRIS